MTTFIDLGVPARLAKPLAARSIVEAFPIQEAAIPDLLAGRDVLGRAPTGSGKTLAFGLPLLARVERAKPKLPRALILAPTRELADQISKELLPLAKATNRWVLAIYGGVGYDFQRRQLRRGADVVVATPGRLTDLIDEGSVSLEDVDIVVLDEADRMADMGFMPQVKVLLDMTNAKRQTILFSATLDKDVAQLTKQYQTDPVTHEVEGDENAGEASHYFWQVDNHQRVQMTADIIGTSTPSIVFTRTRRGADRVAQQLERAGVNAAAIHGGRSQNQRTRALNAFTKGKVQALVATDVAARGIHVDNVASVVHFDLPEDPKDYLHRSGRTARAGADGVVVSFVLGNQMGDAKRLQSSVGLNTAMHDPETDWLTGESGGRIGDAPVIEQKGGGGQKRRPQGNRNGQQPHNRRSSGGHQSAGRNRSESKSRDGSDDASRGTRSQPSRSTRTAGASGHNSSERANRAERGNRSESGNNVDGNRRTSPNDRDGNQRSNSRGRTEGAGNRASSGGYKGNQSNRGNNGNRRSA
ncbi:MAG: DEAD/DEAH box helicase [Acidimicrobiia bacterium]|nr:DEAD/DEAH box helicase [Acidimicrobiia bacterium]